MTTDPFIPSTANAWTCVCVRIERIFRGKKKQIDAQRRKFIVVVVADLVMVKGNPSTSRQEDGTTATINYSRVYSVQQPCPRAHEPVLKYHATLRSLQEH